jgi:hypothetical protein
MNYFKESITVEQIKQTYRELARKLHPDLGGDLELMKLLNAEYLEALKACDNSKTFTSDNKEYTYKYDADAEQALMNKIHEFLAKDFKAVDLLLIGSWLWAVGETKAVKDSIKSMGFKYHSIKKCWFYHIGKWQGKGSKTDLDTLADKYGYKSYRGILQAKIGA